MRDVWIKAYVSWGYDVFYECTSPCGMWGLKEIYRTTDRNKRRRIPIRDAWIELCIALAQGLHPIRDAWIKGEKPLANIIDLTVTSPYGMHGLKVCQAVCNC